MPDFILARRGVEIEENNRAAKIVVAGKSSSFYMTLVTIPITTWLTTRNTLT
jgi:hypothetical protein